jgi:hypothetical protein
MIQSGTKESFDRQQTNVLQNLINGWKFIGSLCPRMLLYLFHKSCFVCLFYSFKTVLFGQISQQSFAFDLTISAVIVI